MYGVLFIGGQALSALSFATAMTILLGRYEPLKRIIRPDYLVDLGKLILAFVMLWAYFAFSQFLIIWSGNLTEEIPWYVDRSNGGWQYLAGFVIFGAFALPFVLLLSRTLKKKGRALAAIAGFIILTRAIDLFWLIEPNFKPNGVPAIPWAQLWMYIVLPVAMGGLWMAAFLTSLRSRPLLPLADPLLKDVLSEGHSHGS
jgi:TRAP-type C4-dicarboxylate transport system permease small subunit